MKSGALLVTMVEVKKPGVTEETWKYEFTCKECCAVLIGTAKDLRLGEFGGCGYAGEHGEMKHYMQCPTCKTDHLINSRTKIPANIAVLAKKDR